MLESRGYAAKTPRAPLEPYSFTRRDVGPRDLQLDLQFCGVCHSDIHQVRDEWSAGIFPMVPGHEIVGKVTRVGDAVKKFKVGDSVGVGCFVDSCRKCDSCKAGLEQYCDGPATFTYNSRAKDGSPTYGGYSTNLVVDEDFALKIPSNLDLSRTAPLLCAGITTYSPLRHWKVARGHRVAVVGLGGLGHMAVKFAAAFGAEVTVMSTSRAKETDAKKLGAQDFMVTSEPDAFKRNGGRFDFIVDTVSAPHDINKYLGTLRRDGVMICVGVPPDSTEIHAMSLIGQRRSLVGSLIGGIRETQEMLDFCGDKNVMSEVEVIPAKEINNAYERMLRGDVRYRFVIDLKSL